MNTISKPVVPTRFGFFDKLCQPGSINSLRTYVEWQCAVRHAHAGGQDLPAFPKSLMPLSINLDITTACNFACTHCIDFAVLNTGIKFDHLTESLQNLIMGGLRSVIIIGGGEPTVDPKFVGVVKLLKEYKIQVAIVTNGTRPEKLLEIMPYLTSGDWIRYSLDSGTNETFTAMHLPKGKMRLMKGGVGPIALESICEWVPSIQAANDDVPVNFSFIVTWPGAEQDNKGELKNVINNIDEIVLAAEMAKGAGFSEISYKAFLSREESGAEVMVTGAIQHLYQTLDRIHIAVKKAQEKVQDDSFDVIVSTNLRVLIDREWQEWQKQPQVCHMIPFRVVLSPLGIFNCPAHRGEERAMITHANGYAATNWVNETQTSRMGRMVSGFNAAQECAEVTCMYSQTNWQIEALIGAAMRNEVDWEDLQADVELTENHFL